jgi:MFS family permease
MRPAVLSPWRMVVGLGLVSLLVDMVSDGAMSVGGAFLGQLGADATLVGLVTGAASAIALALRLATGPWADRTGAYWGFTLVGYALSVVSVPLLAVSPRLGGASLAVASVLVLAERTGKAVRAPAKTVLLADPAAAVGKGKGFGVHKLLDQLGAFAGPLLVAAIAAATGSLTPAFVALVVPGVLAMGLLFWLRARVPDPSVYRPEEAAPATPPGEAAAPVAASPAGTRATFLLFACFAALTTFGLLSSGIVSYHVSEAGLVPLAVVPLVFALGMLVAAVVAPLTGWVYDRRGPAVLFVVPVVTAFVPALVLGRTLPAVLVGVALWGAATGVQDSTVKALVADLVPAAQRGSAYGSFSVFQGVAAFAGAAVAGALYEQVPVLSALVVVLQVAAFALLAAVLRRRVAQTA